MLWGDRMAVKYRIEYDIYDQYQKKSRFKKLYKGLFTVLLLGTVLMLIFWTPAMNVVQEVLVPGDFTVTTDALQQMSDALDTGASFADAMDVFCDAIMDVRH